MLRGLTEACSLVGILRGSHRVSGVFDGAVEEGLAAMAFSEERINHINVRYLSIEL